MSVYTRVNIDQEEDSQDIKEKEQNTSSAGKSTISSSERTGKAQSHRVRNGSVSTDIYWLLAQVSLCHWITPYMKIMAWHLQGRIQRTDIQLCSQNQVPCSMGYLTGGKQRAKTEPLLLHCTHPQSIGVPYLQQHSSDLLAFGSVWARSVTINYSEPPLLTWLSWVPMQ